MKMKNKEEKEDNKFHILYNGIYLNQEEINILNTYGFDYKKYQNPNELMFDIEKYLMDEYIEQLDNVLLSLQEFNYYHNTNK